MYDAPVKLLGGGDMEDTQKKPVAKLVGADGNIFNLMGIAGKALRKAGQGDKVEEMNKRIWDGAESYGEALRIIGEYVEIH